MIDFDSKAKLNLLGARLTVNNLERDKAKEFMDRMIFDRLRGQLASVLTREAVQVTENEFSTDYEVRLYVLTPDQLEKYVSRRAMEIGYRPTVVDQSFVSDER